MKGYKLFKDRKYKSLRDPSPFSGYKVRPISHGSVTPNDVTPNDIIKEKDSRKIFNLQGKTVAALSDSTLKQTIAAGALNTTFNVNTKGDMASSDLYSVNDDDFWGYWPCSILNDKIRTVFYQMESRGRYRTVTIGWRWWRGGDDWAEQEYTAYQRLIDPIYDMSIPKETPDENTRIIDKKTYAAGGNSYPMTYDIAQSLNAFIEPDPSIYGNAPLIPLGSNLWCLCSVKLSTTYWGWLQFYSYYEIEMHRIVHKARFWLEGLTGFEDDDYHVIKQNNELYSTFVMRFKWITPLPFPGASQWGLNNIE